VIKGKKESRHESRFCCTSLQLQENHGLRKVIGRTISVRQEAEKWKGLKLKWFQENVEVPERDVEYKGRETCLRVILKRRGRVGASDRLRKGKEGKGGT